MNVSMKKTIIACKTIEKELETVLACQEERPEIHWLESGLHNVPKKLNARIQEELDKCEGCDCVLMAMGTCGNSVAGLRTGDYLTVIPRVDDCISLLMGSMEVRKACKATYFMTEGWLSGERNIWREYEYCVEKFGEETGKQVFDMMFRNYNAVALLDTGCFDAEKAEAETREIAARLNLAYERISGTLSYIAELLKEGWSEERFILIPPCSVICEEDCNLTYSPPEN